MTIKSVGRHAWRDRVSAEDPSSPLNKTSKAEVRAFVDTVDDEVTQAKNRLDNLEAGVVVGDTLEVGRYVALNRTGSATADHLDMVSSESVPITALSADDLYMVSTIEANAAETPTATINGLGPYDVLNPGGDPPGAAAWGVNSPVFLRWTGTAFRIVLVAAGSDVTETNRATDYLPVVQTNESGNLWVLEAGPSRLPGGAAEFVKLAFVVAYDQGEGGILVDASAIFAGAEVGQVVWPSGAQVSPGELAIGRQAEILFKAKGDLIGKWVLESPAEPTGNVQSIISYYAAGAAARVALQNIGR